MINLPLMADVSNDIATMCWFPLMRMRVFEPALRCSSPLYMTIELSAAQGSLTVFWAEADRAKPTESETGLEFEKPVPTNLQILHIITLFF